LLPSQYIHELSTRQYRWYTRRSDPPMESYSLG
jgi:hypothetical protein